MDGSTLTGAANYLAVGQIYLLDNPLLKEPLQFSHIKPLLPGQWGTSPNLNFLHAHGFDSDRLTQATGEIP